MHLENLRFLKQFIDKRSFIFLQIILIISSFVEMTTVISIIPLINIITEPGIINSNYYLNYIYLFFEFDNKKSFIIFFGLVTLIFFLFSTFLIIYSRIAIINFNKCLIIKLGKIFFNIFLSLKYRDVLKISSSKFTRGLHDDLSRLIYGVVRPGMFIVSKLILTFFLLVSLLVFEFFISLI